MSMDTLAGGVEENPYEAMTVNERLFNAGLLERFDAAFKESNEDTLREILALVNLKNEDAEAIIKFICRSATTR